MENVKMENIVEVSDVEVIGEETEIQTYEATPVVQTQVHSFEKLMEMSQVLAKSTVVPIMYQNRPENVFIALDMASRMGVSPLVVMQNLYVIQGKPSFSGSAIASMIRSNPNFVDVELHYVGTEGKDDWGAYVTAKNVKTGKEIKGATVTIGTAKKEGWYSKTGSKWQTIPEIMLAYRAYAWFGRVYCPEILMGLQTTEEVVDVTDGTVEGKTPVSNPYKK